MTHVAVIDYGMGNLHSVAKALEHVKDKVKVDVTSDPQVVRDADCVLLPGVGAIRDCMAEIRRLGVDKEVAEVIASGKPFLGICVGFQALFDYSAENGGTQCLGEFGGKVNFFSEAFQALQQRDLKVPHMGWNQVHQMLDHPLWQHIDNESRFYFVHSYYAKLHNLEFVAGTCDYGINFDVALARKNVFAVQFHPEKSQHAGLQLLRNFLQWDGQF